MEPCRNSPPACARKASGLPAEAGKIILVSRCAWTLYNFRAGLMRELKLKGWQVLGGGAGGDGYEAEIEELGIPFTPLPIQFKGMNPLVDLKLFFLLWKWYQREKPGVVHHFTIKPVIYGSLAARLAGVPRIVNTITGLGFVFTEERKGLLRFLVETLYRWSLGFAHHVFFFNPDDRKVFLERHLVDPQKTGLLPGSGVDTQYFAPTREINSSNKRVVFLLMARLLRDKGILEFVEAARLVKARFPQAQFQVLGARDKRNPTVISQQKLDQWQAEGVIQYLGFVPDVRPFLTSADVVVLPSYREGTPRSLLEAAAMGKSLIATDVAGCREVVEDGSNGLLVPVKDPPALAQAMVRLIESPEMRIQMGQAARSRMEREFDERMVIEKTLKAYPSEFPEAPL